MFVVKKAKAKGNSKKTAAAKNSSAARKVARPAAKVAAKYEQPGAPWWKRVPGPSPKST
jgi:hypothetical protein